MTSPLPSIKFSEKFLAASQEQMLAVPAKRHDVVERVDFYPSRFFVLTSDSPETLKDWTSIVSTEQTVTPWPSTATEPKSPAPTDWVRTTVVHEASASLGVFITALTLVVVLALILLT